VRDVTLQVPLGSLALSGLLQRDDARATGVEVLSEPLDRAALAGRVAAFKEDDQTAAAVLDRALQLQQLDLQGSLELLVLLAIHPLGVREVLTPGLGDLAVLPDQHRAFLALPDAEAELRGQVVEYLGDVAA
jgi:hypothetical protein